MKIEFNLAAIKDGNSIPAAMEVVAPALFKAITIVKSTEKSALEQELVSFSEKIQSANSCTVEYGACNGCNGMSDAGWVYYYCNSSGGSQPDYKQCVRC